MRRIPSIHSRSKSWGLGGFRVSGFGFQVSGFGFQVSGFRFRASGFGFRVSGSVIRVSGSGRGATAPVIDAVLPFTLWDAKLPGAKEPDKNEEGLRRFVPACFICTTI